MRNFTNLDVRESVHNSIIHKEKSNKMQQFTKIYYFILIWSSTCFGRHTAHHQDPKTTLGASGFLYVTGWWTCSWWTLSGLTRPTTFHVWKTRGCQCNFRLLMMGGVLPETCWASYKYGMINFDTLLHLVGFFCMNSKTLSVCCSLKANVKTLQ